ncbi:MAG TPA: hypothetical protein VEC19_11260 [Usitatibacter sp.]|nr:hypothetical protein [Usitatibacter sp.]
MIAKLVLAASAFTLVACASTSPAPMAGASSASASKATYYCWKDRLYAEGDGYSCNWETSVAAACSSNGTRTFRKGEVSGTPKPAGMCKTGEWLVAVTTG